MKYILFLILTISATNCRSQNNPTVYLRDSFFLYSSCVSSGEVIFTHVTHLPEFKGSIEKYFSKLYSKHFENLWRDDNINNDTVRFCFVVTKIGELCSLKYLTGVTKRQKDVIDKLLMLSPKWQPGTYDGGRALNVYKELSFIFHSKGNGISKISR
jgi:hypothetical protein